MNKYFYLPETFGNRLSPTLECYYLEIERGCSTKISFLLFQVPQFYLVPIMNYLQFVMGGNPINEALACCTSHCSLFNTQTNTLAVDATFFFLAVQRLVQHQEDDDEENEENGDDINDASPEPQKKQRRTSSGGGGATQNGDSGGGDEGGSGSSGRRRSAGFMNMQSQVG